MQAHDVLVLQLEGEGLGVKGLKGGQQRMGATPLVIQLQGGEGQQRERAGSAQRMGATPLVLQLQGDG